MAENLQRPCDLPRLAAILDQMSEISSVASSTEEIAERSLIEIVPLLGIEGATVLIAHGQEGEFSILSEYLPEVKPSSGRKALYAEIVRATASGMTGLSRYSGGRVLAGPLNGADGHLGAIIFFLPEKAPSIFCGDQQDLLAIVATQLGYCIHNSILTGNYREKLLLEQEMVVAQEISDGIMPKKPPRAPGYDLTLYYKTANRIGGDYYDLVPVGGSHLLIVADATGHGSGASLLIASLRAIVRTLARLDLTLEEIVSRTNEILYDDLSASGNSVAAIFCMLGSGGSITGVLAGSHHPLVRESAGTIGLGDSGPLLGTTREYRYRPFSFSLDRENTLMIYTDGIVEQKDFDGNLFGMERLRRLVEQTSAFDLEAMNEIISSELSMFAGTTTFDDDVTYILLRTRQEEQADTPPPAVADYAWEPALLTIRSLKHFDRTFTSWLDTKAIDGELRAELVLAGRELVANAIRYTPNSAPFCRVNARVRSDSVVLTVSDNGPFFNMAETIDREARRIETSPHDKENGRGLYLVSRLATKFVCEELVGRKRIVATFALVERLPQPGK